METEFFTPDNLSIAALRATFDAAMFDVKLDKDEDLIVRDRYRVLVGTTAKNNFIRFTCFFGIKESAGNEAGIALCNRINDKLIIIRASMHKKTEKPAEKPAEKAAEKPAESATSLVIDWYLPVLGGINKKTVVLAFRKFNELVGSMGEHDTDDIIK